MWVVAVREYLAAVRTKTFIISLLLMPLMMGGSILFQVLFQNVVDTHDKTFALVNRTDNPKLQNNIKKAVDDYNASHKPRFIVEDVAPRPDILKQHLELSNEVRAGKLRGFVELSKNSDNAAPSSQNPEAIKPAYIVRYQTNRPADEDFARFVKSKLQDAVREDIKKKTKLDKQELDALVEPAALESRGLTAIDPKTGRIQEASEESRIASLLMPAGLMILMFMVVLMSATPLMQGVVEEKMQRIAEVLLGSVRPFDLMMGKLVGMVGVSLTIAAVYLGGAYWAANRFGFTEFLTPDLLASFVLFQCLAALMYGSLFIAIGAACTDMKETQNLLLPVMLLAMMPMFLLGNVIREPNSPVATGLSFFPFATPMLMITRQAVPPGPPLWQPALGVLLVLATTIFCVYAAGRIFRVGILLQGKGARVGEIARWVFRG
jgi:ABC-2 type transport system permease protein